MAPPLGAIVALGKAAYSFGGKYPALAGLVGPLGVAGGMVALNQGGKNNMASILDIPGLDVNWGNILPGGAPFITAEGPAASWAYAWTANGTNFYRGPMGYLGCYTKRGVWKQWKPYHPIVFGRRDDPRKLARMIKRHRTSWKELNKVYGKSHRSPRSRFINSAPGVQVIDTD